MRRAVEGRQAFRPRVGQGGAALIATATRRVRVSLPSPLARRRQGDGGIRGGGLFRSGLVGGGRGLVRGDGDALGQQGADLSHVGVGAACAAGQRRLSAARRLTCTLRRLTCTPRRARDRHPARPRPAPRPTPAPPHGSDPGAPQHARVSCSSRSSRLSSASAAVSTPAQRRSLSRCSAGQCATMEPTIAASTLHPTSSSATRRRIGRPNSAPSRGADEPGVPTASVTAASAAARAERR